MWTPEFGDSATRLDRLFERAYLPDAEQRSRVFDSASRVLAHGPQPGQSAHSATGLGLGYVQSGKTMSFTAVAALAADNGYRLVVALLGSTDLLLEQNRRRLYEDLELETRDDYIWVPLHRPSESAEQAASLDRYIDQDKTVLITILKNATQVGRTVRLVEQTASRRSICSLIIDDEADQISLNTRVREEELSRTYEEIGRLRDRLGPLLYAQYTATPFAPLLLEARDILSPSFVEVLEPGPEYTGGEAFFLDNRATIVRRITEHEAEDDDPDVVPPGLRRALASYVVGAALLRGGARISGPVSMLVHPSHLTLVHARYKDMVESLIRTWAQRVRREPDDPGHAEVMNELTLARADLVAYGADDLHDGLFLAELRRVLNAVEVWMVNSLSDIQAIEWHRSPAHILIGGNKLDRGFTVRGLTVSYMTRRAGGGQADTIEQRARAFGYKRNYLDYCRFYAPANVIDAFTALVHTEDDLRSSLLEWVEDGRPLAQWGEEVGLVLPGDIRPTRAAVILDPEVFRATRWHTLRRPDLDATSRSANAALVAGTGLLDATATEYGSGISHRRLDDIDVLALLELWRLGVSPGWERDLLLDYLSRRRKARALEPCTLLLMQQPDGAPRRRKWDQVTGVPNLMQGPDEGTGYPGDRNIHEGRPQLQVHDLKLRDPAETEVYALALFIPDHATFGSTIRRRSSAEED